MSEYTPRTGMYNSEPPVSSRELLQQLQALTTEVGLPDYSERAATFDHYMGLSAVRGAVTSAVDIFDEVLGATHDAVEVARLRTTQN